MNGASLPEGAVELMASQALPVSLNLGESTDLILSSRADSTTMLVHDQLTPGTALA